MSDFMYLKCVCIIMFLQLAIVNCSDNNDTRILSRRKRFIIFPEGSSFQLVFCLTYPALISIGDIFLWGNTAALAFELPQDPYSPFDHKADPLHRRMDTKTIYFTDYDGNIIDQKPYKRKFIVNPAFAKRSVDEFEKISPEYKIDKEAMHASGHTHQFFKGAQLENVEFHRRGRAVLYRHVEGLLESFGTDGRTCLLKILCETGQAQNKSQGAFLEQIMTAVFTLPKTVKPDNVDKEYDEAHSTKESCEKLFPCGGNSVFGKNV